MRPNSRDEFAIAIICALTLEAEAVEELFDKTYDRLGEFYKKQPGDDNAYVNGRIGAHNVVLCYMPGMGKGNAASVASSLKISYKRIEVALIIGICGGAPYLSNQEEIFLGDVIIGDAVVEYDFGRQHPGGFDRKTGVKDTLGRPNQEIRSLLAGLQAKRSRRELQAKMLHHLQEIQGSQLDWGRPNSVDDILFEASYQHKHYGSISHPRCLCLDDTSDNACEAALETICTRLGCDEDRICRRRHRTEHYNPRVHIGKFASADTVMRSGIHRDNIIGREEVIGFEMEGAGVWDNIPCIIIKGVCDYADSHKNKAWQAYAAATGAATAKAFLEYWKPAVGEGYTSEDQRCLQDVFLSHPDDDRRRIEAIKGGLLDDSFRWILDNAEYQRWWNNPGSQLLWIKGDSGKGKTMLVIGIIKQLLKPESSKFPAYFFCQGTDPKLNNATAVLRGLIYMLIIQQPHLISHLRQRYSTEGKRLFEGGNAFYSLSAVFENIIGDLQQPTVHLLIDALDECKEDLENLLRLIAKTMSMTSVQVKWIVTSRNMNHIEEILDHDHEANTLSLELNADRISRAIETYIYYKVSHLKILQHDQELQERVKYQLCRKSDGTFLWVALVIEELRKCHLEEEVLDALEDIPTDLSKLYDQMIGHIDQLKGRRRDICVMVLSMVVLAYRPLHLSEICHLTGIDKRQEVDRAIILCGSFLSIRDEYVYLIHQSAKDHLDNIHATTAIFWERSTIHHKMFSRSVETLSTRLRQNIYNLENPGVLASEVATFQPHPDPLLGLRYSCTYWLDHFLEVDPEVIDNSEAVENRGVMGFFKKHLLHWLESLSLIGEVPHGILSFRRLAYRQQAQDIPHSLSILNYNQRYTLSVFLCNDQAAVKIRRNSVLLESEKFVNSYGSIIEKAPLQTYSAALVFCPQKSEIKRLHWDERLKFIKNVFGTQECWDSCVQTLRGHTGSVNAVVFSSNGQMLASACEDHTIRLWDAATGTLKRILLGHNGSARALVFSPNNQALASSSDDHTVRLWDVATGVIMQTLRGSNWKVHAIAFSPDNRMLASASMYHTVRLWDIATGAVKQNLKGHTNWIHVIAFSPDGQVLASASDDNTIRLWDPATGTEKQKAGGWNVRAITFSPNGRILTFALADASIHLWDTTTGVIKQVMARQDFKVDTVTFSPNGRVLALASLHRIQLWDIATGSIKQRMGEISSKVHAVAFSPNSRMFASASDDHNIRLWDTTAVVTEQTLRSHNTSVNTIVISPHGQILASSSNDGNICLWDIATGTVKQILQGDYSVSLMAFSPNGNALAFVSDDYTVQFWNLPAAITNQDSPGHIISANLLASSPDRQILLSDSDYDDTHLWNWNAARCRQEQCSNGHTSSVTALTFSPDSQILASASNDHTIRLWDTRTGKMKKTLNGHSDSINAVVISPNGRILASASKDYSVRIWDIATGKTEQILNGHSGSVNAVVISPNGQILASASNDNSVRVWDLATSSVKQILLGHTNSANAVAFSLNGQVLASASDDNTLRVWDTVMGKETHICSIGIPIKTLSFSSDSCLNTERGSLTLRPSCSEDFEVSWSASGIYISDKWVTRDGQNLVLLPANYRATCAAVCGNFVVLSHESGYLSFLEMASA
ncbi:WD40-repeat-containing domain protein [Talaromyces proteolyticus]|uniref:WD40-repeat-containing domain protein n=1 Tax=Talaromyces proteolyticus TaxID=1131652 RepID=A0AAD4KGU4_9EURO|nr:WD40-repeat-containing domain protein [Talaromyces proteolyticus]KAH8692058.1 WD40-repeat-containing domain protein [Talaromyces proteolyticus]